MMEVKPGKWLLKHILCCVGVLFNFIISVVLAVLVMIGFFVVCACCCRVVPHCSQACRLISH